MNDKQPRLLIFGAGVIGSIYTLRFIQSGMDVTMLARGSRLEELKKHGLRYNEEGIVKSVSVNVIETLKNDDIYDFIFVPVRYDQALAALTVLKDNKSKNIIPLTNTVGYDKWTSIVGERLIPGFPGASGDIKDGILYARFAEKNAQGTLFGEISGIRTNRISELAQIFESSKLPYKISDNILAFHISHAAIVARNKHFYTSTGLVDAKTAKRISVLKGMALDIKKKVSLIEKAGFPITDPMAERFGNLPIWANVLLFRIMLTIPSIRNILLGEHLLTQKQEILQLDADLSKIINSN